MGLRNRKHLNREAGFGLTGALVAAFIGLIVVGGLVESIINMMRSQRSVEMSAEGLLFGEQLQVALENQAACMASLGAAQMGRPLDLTTPGGIPISMPVKIGDQIMTVTAGSMIAPNLKLKTFNLAPLPLAPASPLNTPPQNPVPYIISFTPRTAGLRYKMKLIYTTEKVQGSYSPVSQPHEVVLNVTADNTHMVKGCVAENEDTKACEQLGGIWNPLGADGERCVSLQHCDWGGSYAQVAPGNGVPVTASFTNQLTGDYSCPTEYVPVQTGAISSAKRYGKKGVQNVYDPVYSCLRCGATIATQDAPVTSFDLGTGISDAIQDLDDSETTNANRANNNVATGDAIIGNANSQTATTNAQTSAIEAAITALGL